MFFGLIVIEGNLVFGDVNLLKKSYWEFKGLNFWLLVLVEFDVEFFVFCLVFVIFFYDEEVVVVVVRLEEFFFLCF